MLKRTALMVALGVFVVMAAEVNAARRGGCPNGQCGVYTYQPAAKVAVAKDGTAQVASTTPAADAAPATQTQYVASQPVRRPFFRRWAR